MNLFDFYAIFLISRPLGRLKARCGIMAQLLDKILIKES